MSHPNHEDSDLFIRVAGSAEFTNLKRSFRRFVFPMTLVFLGWYLLYVIASGWARDFMGHELWGNINVAYVFGLLQFVSTFAITMAYAHWADTKFDAEADRLRAVVEAGEVAR